MKAEEVLKDMIAERIRKIGEIAEPVTSAAADEWYKAGIEVRVLQEAARKITGDRANITLSPRSKA